MLVILAMTVVGCELFSPTEWSEYNKRRDERGVECYKRYDGTVIVGTEMEIDTNQNVKVEISYNVKEIRNLYRKGRGFLFGEDVSCPFYFG